MNKQQELEHADRSLKEILSQVESLKFHLRQLEDNIALLNGIKVSFNQNLSILKSDKIIPSMSEYQKIKNDLNAANNRLYVMRIDQNNHLVALERAEKMLLEYREKYVTLLNNQDAKVLRGDFGKK